MKPSRSTFNLTELKKELSGNDRFERRLSKLSSMGQEVGRIQTVVTSALSNIQRNQNSFVIYGEPQSGKTELMIALAAKLLDEGHKLVIILLNDSVQLLGQNLERFQSSGLSPSPKKFSELLPSEVKLGDNQWVIFCKKNSKDLQKLLEKVRGQNNRVIIDDEADYATPNSKINSRKKSQINQLTGDLIGREGVYIGVTATPARLDLNRTHQNQNESWIDFPPHSKYTGQDVFFPVSLQNLAYRLTFLPDGGDHPKYLREALFSFMVTVGYLNACVNETDRNYSILIHTSGKKADHSIDYKQVVKIFGSLRNHADPYHKSYYNRIWDIANARFPQHADRITKYILSDCDRNNIVVMNSDKEVNAAGNKTATDPTAPFTVVIGGNIVSRGVTFNNLLSMFFTRDVKHKLQQDTYIQRARMFGSRDDYLKHFELTIPKPLYLDWQKCFIFHRLSLESRKQNNRSPVWLDGQRVTAAASGSIDKTSVIVDRGEMSFEMFDYSSNEHSIKAILDAKSSPIQKIREVSKLLGSPSLPEYLIRYIESFCPAKDKSIAVHSPRSVAGYTNNSGTDTGTITRAKGFIGDSEMEVGKFPNAIHHINILHNQHGKARVFYRYRGNVRFLKTPK